MFSTGLPASSFSAQPFSKVTWARGIDQKTGRPMVNPESRYGTEAMQVFPGGGGAHNWSPMSFNPNAGLVYIPTSTNNSFTYAAEDKFDPKPGDTTGDGAAGAESHAGSGGGDWSGAWPDGPGRRGAGGVGSGGAETGVARAGRRWDRRRNS